MSSEREQHPNAWQLRRYTDEGPGHFEDFRLALHFPEGFDGGSAAPVRVTGCLSPFEEGAASLDGAGCGTARSGSSGRKGSDIELEGEVTKAALRLEHRDPQGTELYVYRTEHFVSEGDGQFRGVWMCGARTGRFSAMRLQCAEEPRKRKSACRRKAEAAIKNKRFVNDLKDELLILDRLGWSEKRWKEESKIEKGRAILGELRRELEGIFSELGLGFHENTPWLRRVEVGILLARRRGDQGDQELLRRLRAADCCPTAAADDFRSDWHTLFEIQRHCCALPPFRATKYLEPSNVRHTLRCAEVANRAAFERGRYIGGARRLSAARLPRGGKPREELHQKMLEELRGECIAGDLGVDEAYGVHIQLVVRAGCSDFLWEPGPEVKLHCEDRVYYDHAHVCGQDRRGRRHGAHDAEEMRRRLAEFERLLTCGDKGRVYEEDFEFVEMTARAENGTAEGVPAFLEHSVTGDVEHAQKLFEQQRWERGWAQRPKALNLEHLFRTRLAGYRRQGTREIVWGPGPDLYWERGDRPLRLFRVAQEPVRVRFHRHEEPYGFHLQDLSGGGGGAEVIEVVEGSPADARGIVVGRTVKRLCTASSSEDVRHWSRTQIEAALTHMPDCFVIEFGKGDTEERRHAPLGDAEMAILMDERFMRGFLHELGHVCEDPPEAGAPGGVGPFFDQEGWNAVFPGLVAAPRGPAEASAPEPAEGPPRPPPPEASHPLLLQDVLPPPGRAAGPPPCAGGAAGAPPPSGGPRRGPSAPATAPPPPAPAPRGAALGGAAASPALEPGAPRRPSWPAQPGSPAAGAGPSSRTPLRAAPGRCGSPMRVALAPGALEGPGALGGPWASPGGAGPPEAQWAREGHGPAWQEAARAAQARASPSPRRGAVPPTRPSPAQLDHRQDPPLKVQIGRHSQPQVAVGPQAPQRKPVQRAAPRAWASFHG